MESMVSVIIPVYNRQEYIEECISSVLAQSYQIFEIILIDDGSTDRSVEICESLAQRDSRIKLLKGTHQGVSAARNLGLDAAQGEYVFFLDSDDVIHPRIFESLLCSMDSNGAPMGGSICRAIRADNWDIALKKWMNQSEDGDSRHLTNNDALNGTFVAKTPFSMIGGVMIRRQWIGETRFRTDLTIGEDFYFIYENLIKGASAVFLNPRWYYNRVHNDNTSWDYTYSGFMTRFLRRRLVWESEEGFGRIENVNRQKMEVLGIYFTCVKRAGIFSADGKKMRSTLREYRKTLLPGMRFRVKIAFLATLYIPPTAKLIFCYQKLKRAKKNN